MIAPETHSPALSKCINPSIALDGPLSESRDDEAVAVARMAILPVPANTGNAIQTIQRILMIFFFICHLL